MPIDPFTASLLIAAAKACIAKAGALHLTGHNAMSIIHTVVPAHIVAAIQELVGPHGIVQTIFGHHALAATAGHQAFAGHQVTQTAMSPPYYNSPPSGQGCPIPVPPAHQFVPAANFGHHFPPIQTPQYTGQATYPPPPYPPPHIIGRPYSSPSDPPPPYGADHGASDHPPMHQAAYGPGPAYPAPDSPPNPGPYQTHEASYGTTGNMSYGNAYATFHYSNPGHDYGMTWVRRQ